MRALLNLEEASLSFHNEPLSEVLKSLEAGHSFNVPEQPLFQKITPEVVAELSERYGAEVES